MSDDLEPRSHDEPQPPEVSPASTGSDPWHIWFSRAMQIFGLLFMLFEAARILFTPAGTFSERPWLMMFSAGMMLGGMGLQAVLRWAMARAPQ